ncbi:MAG: sigma-54 dependent transcriptional regulator [Vicinamibacterales bacterium]|jgi:DNA-binding NtrC family response regulator|nr:sigma-54 dependent transcriptional regulator [Vicinamibacterales bacterium]MDP7480155.1 sigma-54 dependent transcriptional regulator [Vicinamibacterales bacterium]MDP7690932.1 sigma-54 dependent transcriptional regulator [Vicinamibacterales bacterium]HJN46788.1 sigma-54 dependent transcriptional regulator [Vicinamibacterales bacterium]|tara:strand:+ start:1251 stop:2630 length:1380 start_codon:yes stop_codon:yes gene_type:complete
MIEKETHLLLVEDEAPLREATAERLAGYGYQVVQAESGEAAVEQLTDFAFDVVLTDLRLPGIDGAEVLAAALERYPEIVCIVVTGFGTVKDAVDAIKRGAAEFITKPFQFDQLLHVIAAALEQRRLRSENAYLRSQLEERHRFEGLVGRSPRMRELFELLETVAASTSTVLVTGETGTGKELAAKAIHHNSSRRTHRFVALNCSAVPETLLEAELFGHVRGAFTGAVATRQGRLETAHQGTLFLDEVGAMSSSLQAKLLRVLQERELERVGDNRTIKIDVRIIAATNADLSQLVCDGLFREDLYYRLNVIPIFLPPLRERREDIPVLVQHFIERLTSREVPPRKITVTQEALRRMMAYAWPGNIRQLENAVERALALGGDRTQFDVRDLPPELQHAPAGEQPVLVSLPEGRLDMPAYIADIERQLIQRALEETDGNKQQAARLLGLKRTTLVEKARRLL